VEYTGCEILVDLKKEGNLPFVTTEIHLEEIMEGEISQRRANTARFIY